MSALDRKLFASGPSMGQRKIDFHQSPEDECDCSSLMIESHLRAYVSVQP